MVFDQERHGIWVYTAPEASASAPTVSMFYDIRLEGYWPQKFTNVPNVGPLSAIQWDGIGSDARYPLLGGYDGVLYWQSRNRRSDNYIDGVAKAISSYVVFGPYNLSVVDDAVVSKVDIINGEPGIDGETDSNWELDWTLQAARTAFGVTEGTPLLTDTGSFLTSGKNVTLYPRLRGGWFTLKIACSVTDKYFTFESGALHLAPGGMQR
jgi:hypothetical protein